MKKIILLLTLFTYMEVQAATYTEYEFVGYQETQPIVDELTKYETLTKHRYYTQVKGEYEKVDLYDPTKDTYDFCEPTTEIEHIETTPSDVYPNEAYIVLRGAENYEATNVNFKMDTTSIVFKKILIKEGNTIIKTLNYQTPQANIDISLDHISIDDLKIIVEHTGSGYVTFTLDGVTSSKIGIGLMLTNQSELATIKPLSLAKIQELGYSNNKLQYFYRYTEETYNCTNYERKYITDEEYDSNVEYLFDEREDITIYKVFKRKLSDQSTSEPPKESEAPSEPQEPEQTDKEDESSPQPQEPADEETTQSSPPNVSNEVDDIKPSSSNTIEVNSPQTVPNVPISTNKTTSTKYTPKHEPSLKTEDTENTNSETSNEELTQIAFLDEDEKDDTTTVEDASNQYENLAKTLRDIKLLLLILIILTIVHTIQLLYVNNRN